VTAAHGNVDASMASRWPALDEFTLVEDNVFGEDPRGPPRGRVVSGRRRHPVRGRHDERALLELLGAGLRSTMNPLRRRRYERNGIFGCRGR